LQKIITAIDQFYELHLAFMLKTCQGFKAKSSLPALTFKTTKMSLHSERSHWTTDSVGFSVDDRNVVRSVSAGSFAQEAGLSPGDEIISVGDEMISRSSHSSHLMTVIKRQNTFPPSICVVSRVKFATIYVGESEEMGIEVEEYYESEIEEARKTPAIRK
jgi:predicted metalloprotease with PDZ domain